MFKCCPSTVDNAHHLSNYSRTEQAVSGNIIFDNNAQYNHILWFSRFLGATDLHLPTSNMNFPLSSVNPWVMRPAAFWKASGFIAFHTLTSTYQHTNIPAATLLMHSSLLRKQVSAAYNNHDQSSSVEELFKRWCMRLRRYPSWMMFLWIMATVFEVSSRPAV
jgi:hypothetical protein